MVVLGPVKRIKTVEEIITQIVFLENKNSSFTEPILKFNIIIDSTILIHMTKIDPLHYNFNLKEKRLDKLIYLTKIRYKDITTQ